MALEVHERFGVGVAVHIAKVLSSDYKGSKLYPCLELIFHNEDGHESAGDNKEISLFS
jgi:hypothetical protein